MSAPTTFVDAITRLRDVLAVNKKMHAGVADIIKDTRYSSGERKACEGFNAILKFNNEQLREISVGIAQLAMATSKEDFDKIIAAVAE